MEIKNVITIDHLTTDSVSVKTQRVLVDSTGSYPLGEPSRTSYTKDCVETLIDEVSEPYLSAILSVWGIDDGWGIEEGGAENEEEMD